MLVKTKVLCLATYEATVDVPTCYEHSVSEYLRDHIPDFEVDNLEYFDDMEDGDGILSYQCIEE